MTFEYSKSPLSTSESYEFCKKLTKREAKNFYYAFLTLPYHQRLAAFSGYAFCRICDDAVDEPGTNDEKNREIIDFFLLVMGIASLSQPLNNNSAVS